MLEKEPFRSQLMAFRAYLMEHTATATMCAIALGIPQKNICRYKRELEKRNMLWEVRFHRCEITGFSAFYLTCDPRQKLESDQLELEL